MTDLFDTGGFEDLLATHQLTPRWSCLACGASWAGDAAHDCPAAAKPDRTLEHLIMAKTCKAFRVRPYQIGVDMGCACHSAPFPAARDYRRRTRHRNRRRR